MFEISKIKDLSVLHFFGEFSSLQVDWVSRVIESFKKYDHNKILIDLAYADYVHFQAVRHWVVATRDQHCQSGAVSNEMEKFTGTDQPLKDYSLVAGAMLHLLKPPVLPVGVFLESVAVDGDLEVDERTVSLSGMFFH